MAINYETFKDGGLKYVLLKLKTVIDTLLADKVDNTTEATDSTLGLVKTNSAESVTLNADGQLDVGGRLGAFSGTTGIFHSKDREPRRVSDFSFLITDAKGMNLAASRDLAIATGVNLTLTKSHAAGSTTYTVANTYANRMFGSRKRRIRGAERSVVA